MLVEFAPPWLREPEPIPADLLRRLRTSASPSSRSTTPTARCVGARSDRSLARAVTTRSRRPRHGVHQPPVREGCSDDGQEVLAGARLARVRLPALRHRGARRRRDRRSRDGRAAARSAACRSRSSRRARRPPHVGERVRAGDGVRERRPRPPVPDRARQREAPPRDRRPDRARRATSSLEEQETWLNEGFRSSGLFHYLMDNHERYHTILLTPYMFWTTYACAQIAPHKNVLRPCLHDEVFARLDIYKPIFRDARGITFNTDPEAELARGLFELPPRTEVVAEGIDDPDGRRPGAVPPASTGSTATSCCTSGRREWGKNVDVLARVLRALRPPHAPRRPQARAHRTRRRRDPDARSDTSSSTSASSTIRTSTTRTPPRPSCASRRCGSRSRVSIMEAWVGGTPVLGYGGLRGHRAPRPGIRRRSPLQGRDRLRGRAWLAARAARAARADGCERSRVRARHATAGTT